MTIFNKEIQGGGKFDEIPHPHPKPLRGRQTILRGRLGHIKKIISFLKYLFNAHREKKPSTIIFCGGKN